MFRTLFALALVGSLALVAASAAKADHVGGPKGTDDCIAAYQTLTYNAYFHDGELARVGIIGDGDTDLDLYVYDENGILIASDTDSTDRCLVSWVPKWTGRFTIKVVNRGCIANEFRLRTN